MRREGRELQQWAGAGVGPVEIHDRIARRYLTVAVNLRRRCADDSERGIVAKRDQRLDFGAARAADAPRLLENARALLPVRIDAVRDVVVAPRGEQSGKTAKRRLVVHER